MKTTRYTLEITTPDKQEFDSDLIQQILFDNPEFIDCLINVRQHGIEIIEICTIDETDLTEDKKREHCELTLFCERCKYCDLDKYMEAERIIKKK